MTYTSFSFDYGRILSEYKSVTTLLNKILIYTNQSG